MEISELRVGVGGDAERFEDDDKKVDAPKPKVILLLDDDKEQRCIYGTLLRRSGYHVITAATPLEAVQILDHVKIDLLISDIYMPGISGDEFVGMLKEMDAIREIPTILLTAARPELADLVLEDNGPDMFCLKSEAVRLLPAQVAFLIE